MSGWPFIYFINICQASTICTKGKSHVLLILLNTSGQVDSQYKKKKSHDESDTFTNKDKMKWHRSPEEVGRFTGYILGQETLNCILKEEMNLTSL